ncbi:hypothetical protein CP533_1194 [Ophiocordyceps camponoti-saundersi (nom. inval.)]|nr:hypothetical protein CP533_1194 [Ophiocordyceps camponoti-saundersi (nom. inval.)]
MSNEQARDANAPRGHRRSRSSKGSADSSRHRGDAKGSSTKTKDVLSRALEKANVAVELDRAQNFEAARPAYLEACKFLRHVLQKTSGDEDKRKLEQIVVPALDLVNLARHRSCGNKITSTFSRSSARHRSGDEGLSAGAHLPPPTMTVRPLSPGRPQRHVSAATSAREGSLDESNIGHNRDDSQNSWLDPIEESIGSTRSSVHSRTSSFGYRRRHLRKTSGNTEIEFDTALDAAIEAAYDDGYELDGYGQGEANDEVVSRALRKVEMARERVRQTQRELQENSPHKPQLAAKQEVPDGFFEDDSSEEEERMLDEIARDYGLQDFATSRQRKASVSSRPESRGRSLGPWRSPAETSSAMEALPFSKVNGSIGPRRVVSKTLRPSAPPPTQSLPELPAQRSASSQSVRNRRLSGQNAKQLVIDTSDRRPPPPPPPATTSFEELLEPHKATSTTDPGREAQAGDVARVAAMSKRRASPRTADIVPSEPMFLESPPRSRVQGDGDGRAARRSGSPSASKLRKNVSSSSLRSSRGRNMTLSHVDDAPDVSPGTPSSNYRPSSARAGASATPVLPTPLAATFREQVDGLATGGLHLFEDSFHLSTVPSATPTSATLDIPVPLEPCPNDFLLRPFWLMRCLYQTLAHPRGGYLSTKLFVPKEVWKVKGVKLKGVEDKISCCDYITARLQKLSRVDTCDADAVLDEMEGLEVVLEQVQVTLSRRLGSDVGVQGAGTLFKEASNVMDAEGASGMPRAASISSKSSFSWRRLRSKNSAMGLAGTYSGKQGGSLDGAKDQTTMPTLPMTSHVSSRPAERDVGQAQFMGPNAIYMSSLARLFDAVQVVDQIARQIDDPGLRHADKTQVGLELSTRRVAEFFAFYICRFVLTDLGLLLDKFIKRGSEWVLANFCIVAHIDHGKSTLSDRLLELTQTISKSDANKQILDKLDVERERGITVKAQTCTMIFALNGVDYLLHLVDTPGHVDFRAEVTRSYASCGGALLLIDATQGIQAQTVSNFHLAFAQDLALVPVINKIDMASADVPRVLEQMETTLELSRKDALLVSAKTGRGVPDLLPAVVERIPHPVGDAKKPLKVLLVDSWYDNFRGVVLLVRVFDGCVRAGDSVISLGTGARYTVGQVGIQYPNATPQAVLRAGQVGYMFFSPGMKRIQDAKLGDTLTTVANQALVEPCPGFEEPKPMVFAAAFPTDQNDYEKLADSMSQLVLNDRSVTLQPEYSEALGAGWRLGFLGSLHCSVFQDRLKQEHGRNIIITEPTVPTKILWPDGTEEVVQNPVHFPDATDNRIRSATLFEPYVHATITVPQEYVGRAIEICEVNRGEQKSLEFFDAEQVILVYDIPAAQLVEDLFDKLKSASKGYATLDYEDAGWRESKLAKLQLLVNKEPVDAICRIVHMSQADRIGRNWVTKFKDHVDRQMFEVIIQAVIGKKVLARETIKPFRKDVLAKLHASDITRRQKLLTKQKEGRKRLRAVGNVVIRQEAFQGFLSK